MFTKTRKILGLLVLCAVSTFITFNALADALSLGGGEVAPPRYEVSDVYQVNMLSGQVSPSLSTISIGGDKGLNHSISMFANDFTYKGWRGYQDKYVGKAKYTFLGNNLYYQSVLIPQLAVMRVFSAVGSADFLIVDGNGVRDFYVTSNGIPSEYSYEAIGDKRHTLVEIDNGVGLLWTLPDGTTVKYERSVNGNIPINAIAGGSLKDITYPNGFKITHHGLSGVTTNTGFQLKYDYTAVNTGLESSKQSATFPLSPNAVGGWEDINPEYIRAINNVIEYCDPTIYAACPLNQTWPNVKFTWPGGMPRAFFIGDSVFQVDVSTGPHTLSTKYHYQAQDLALRYPDLGDVGGNEGGTNRTRGYAIGERFMARLVGIQPTSSTKKTISYRYRNRFEWISERSWHAAFTFQWLSSKSGEILSANGPVGGISYELDLKTAQGNGVPTRNTSNWKERLKVTRSLQYPGTLTEVNKPSTGNIVFEQNHRNFITYISGTPGPNKSYSYDSRGNTEKVSMHGDGITTNILAKYPLSCTNKKTCNQPIWTRDAKGNQTDYTYHEASGQIESVTKPANKQNNRPKTRYSYVLKKAKYKINSDTKTESPDGIWLLDTERYCIDSNTASNSCSGNDEVVTKYQYEPGNLSLKGIEVTADGKTLLTCYSYDIYGNNIGTTLPKANLATCPN